MKNIIKIVGLMSTLGVATCMLAGCMGEDEPNIQKPLELCDAINNKTFVSATLEDGGLTASGTLSKMHWRLSLKDGVITTMQSDAGMAGVYECVGDTVTATIQGVAELPMVFSNGYTTLEFTPYGTADTVTYNRYEGKYGNTDCGKVNGLSFAPSNALAADVDKAPALIAALDIRVAFGDDQMAALTENGKEIKAIFDCELDSMHIHRSVADESPIVASYDERAGTLTVASKGQSQILHKVEDPVLCIALYDPVCGVVPQNVQCLVAPCSIGNYKTFGNSCNASVAGANVAFAGECGELEGQPAYDDTPVACTKEYAPVCAAVTQVQPCLTMPCPSQTHKTYGNRCMADADRALFVKNGECGGLEGAPLLNIPDVACAAIFDPVCGKDESGIVCVTTPCPTHVYKTQSNACAAAAVLAEVVYSGECGLLEGAEAEGQPPAKMVASKSIPATYKTPSITNVAFNGDILNLQLGYSGCSEQHFDLYIDDAFMESLPVQVKAAFIPQVEDECEAVFLSQFSYDLAPLRSAYQSMYKATTGSVVIQNVGVFEF